MNLSRPSIRPARALGFWPVLALTVALAGHAATAAAAGNTLQTIDVQPLPDHRMQLVLHLAAPAPTPLTFAIDNPARISLDLPGTALAQHSRRIDVHSGGLDSIAAVEAKDRTRVVLNLDKMLPYTTRVDGDNVIVTLGERTAAASTAAPAAPAVSAPSEPAAADAASSAGPGIRSIDFRRGSDGAGRVIVKLSDSHIPVNLRQVGNQIVVDFAGADLPPNLMRRYDAVDFGTPVTDFTVTHPGKDTRLVIDATGQYEQLAYQSDDQYVVEVQPLRKAAATPEERRAYTGERLTLNFQDIETRAVLQLLADASGQNIVVSDSVKGNVTLRLQNVPWDQALDIVLKTKGLDKRHEGNVIIVAPSEELASRERAELAARKDLQELSPVHTEFLQVNYAKASDMAALISGRAPMGGAAGGGAGQTSAAMRSMLSPRGAVSVDQRTNTLLVQDTAEKIADIRRMVATLDIPVRQVLIESRLVIVNDDFKRELGTVLGYTGITRNGSNGIVTTTGTAAGTDQILSSAIGNVTKSGTPYPVTVPTGSTAANRYNINLPTPDAGGTIALGVLGADYLLDLELSAAQAETRADIVSAPRVVTANQKKATIEQGTEIPYQQSASSGATTIQFQKAVLSLEVTPQITPDNRIILDLDVKKDSVGQVIVASGGVNVPAIDTQEITNEVIVNDGQTVVLGGILQTEDSVQETKIPFLGDIPILGNLFKQTTTTKNKDELLIFVTPKILREGVNVY